MRARLGVVLMLLVVGLVVGTPASGVLADPFYDAQGQRSQLNGQIRQQQGQIHQIQGQEARAQAQLQVLTGQIQAAEANLADENARLDAILGQIDQAQRDLEAKRAELDREQSILNQRTRTLYKQGGNETFIDSLLTARTFSDLLNRFIVMRDITHANQLLVAQIKADKAAIENLTVELHQKRDEQATTVQRIKDQTNALRGQYVQLNALRGQLATEQLSLEQKVAEAKRALAQVNAEIAALMAARGSAHSSGILAWPGVQGPITQGFGCTDLAGEPPPPPGYGCPPGKPYFHTGIDIAGPYGANVTSADGGIAYTYASSFGYGNHVIIIHANGFATLYGHLSSFAVGSGGAVGKGQLIGYEGSTGFSTGAHLHFEVRVNGQPVNPCQYVGC